MDAKNAAVVHIKNVKDVPAWCRPAELLEMCVIPLPGYFHPCTATAVRHLSE